MDRDICRAVITALGARSSGGVGRLCPSGTQGYAPPRAWHCPLARNQNGHGRRCGPNVLSPANPLAPAHTLVWGPNVLSRPHNPPSPPHTLVWGPNVLLRP